MMTIFLLNNNSTSLFYNTISYLDTSKFNDDYQIYCYIYLIYYGVYFNFNFLLWYISVSFSFSSSCGLILCVVFCFCVVSYTLFPPFLFALLGVLPVALSSETNRKLGFFQVKVQTADFFWVLSKRGFESFYYYYYQT